MNPQVLAMLLDLVYFAAGLSIGLFGLWQSQKHFMAQQQDKFNKIDSKLGEIGQELVRLRMIASKTSHEREDKLMRLIVQNFGILRRRELLSYVNSVLPDSLRADDDLVSRMIRDIEEQEQWLV